MMSSATPTPLLFGLPLEYAVFAGVLLVIMLALPLLGSPQQKLSKRANRLHKRVKDKSTFASKLEKEDKTQQSLRRAEGDKSLPLLSRLLGHRGIASALRYRIARSGSTLTAERYLAYNVLLFAITTLVFIGLFDRSNSLSILMGVVVGLGLPHFILGVAIGRRTKKFLELFPDAIDLIVRGLRAGLPVTESIKMVAKEIGEPVSNVFQTMTEKMALGVPLEKTLYDTAAKYRITEFDFFVTSIVLQRETGGNLSEILNNLSDALRQRLMMRLKIRAMSSEARASMYIISALPFVVMGGLYITTPSYLVPLVDDYRGNVALAIAGCMLLSGVFIMSRMTRFEI
jgi:tight adherence protein B